MNSTVRIQRIISWRKLPGISKSWRTISNLHSSKRCFSNQLGDQHSTQTPNETTEFYDIVIAGGGLIGSMCGVAIAASPLLSNKKVLLLEASPSLTPRQPSSQETSAPPFSNRVFALSPGSKAFLEKIKIWPDLPHHNEVYSMQVWDALSNCYFKINNPGFSEPVSYIVENPLLLRALETHLKNFSEQVSVQFGCSLRDCKFPGSGMTDENSNGFAEAILSNGKKIAAELIIGADGYNSKVRSCMGSPYISGSYHRTAVVATLQLEEPTENNVAWQRFLPSGGPIALLPLSPQYSSLVWSTYPENAKKLMGLSEEEFVSEINIAMIKDYPKNPLVSKSLEILEKFNLNKPGNLPPSISQIVPKSRATFPLGFGHAAYYVNRRAALIGDAAHRVHPLGGQGLNLGIGDVNCLVNTLEKSVSWGENIGGLERLKYYETERMRHNLLIQSGLEFLHYIYATDAAPVVLARSLGSSFVNSSERLKNCIIAQAAA